MKEQAPTDTERRLRYLERQNRLLIVLFIGSLAASSIAISNAQPAVLTATEVRAQRFTLVDPNGGIADDWYVTAASDRDNTTRLLFAPYSGWPHHRP
jgi:hypothetical protein